MGGIGTYVKLVSQKFCASNQRRFIRAARLIMQLAVTQLRDHGMAHGQ